MKQIQKLENQGKEKENVLLSGCWEGQPQSVSHQVWLRRLSEPPTPLCALLKCHQGTGAGWGAGDSECSHAPLLSPYGDPATTASTDHPVRAGQVHPFGQGGPHVLTPAGVQRSSSSFHAR